MIEFAVALIAGLLAGISPCTITVYPALLSRLTRSKEDPKWVSVFFALGLAGVYFLFYAVFGALSSILGYGLLENAETWRGRLTLIGALVSWFMAYSTLSGGLKIPTIHLFKGEQGEGYFGALATGFIYGTFISPCNAVFLFTGILPALMYQSSIFSGMLLLAIFTTTMAIPLLLLGWASGIAITTFGIIKKNVRKLELVSAGFLILAGLYFFYLFLLTTSLL